ncbi:MAG: folylpolyglutamate synthase/dihydrofolate synthase family protein [Gemmatimonadota bacterium]|nr:folylpolyglutamate synthase/dihydrofolate synthase family protein [Gemmatimonadota bacterium]
MSDYQKALQYLYSFVDYEKLPGAAPEARTLDLIEGLLEALDHPERRWPSVHVTGTKGKGSTAAMIASVVQKSGYGVGLYTSPHMVTYRERLVVNGQKISKKEFCRLIDKARTVLDVFVRDAETPPTFFDVWTALAFLYFAESGVDLAVVEVGLGGRLDSTNVLMPEAAVITPIGLDHTDRLGTTLTEIAGEKAGIIKRGIPTIVGPQEPEALAVIQEACVAMNSPLTQVGEDLRYTIRHADRKRQVFDVESQTETYHDLDIPLMGSYQVTNAATAIGVVEILKRGSLPIFSEAIAGGLQATRIPGRFQMVQENPCIILDGAHNVLSVQTLAQTLQTLFPERRIIIILSLQQDKDVAGVCGVLSSAGDAFIVTSRQVVRKRQAEPESVAALLRASGKPVTVTSTVREALDLAQTMAGPEGVVCVTGSFYLVGETIEVLHNLEPEEMMSR